MANLPSYEDLCDGTYYYAELKLFYQEYNNATLGGGTLKPVHFGQPMPAEFGTNETIYIAWWNEMPEDKTKFDGNLVEMIAKPGGNSYANILNLNTFNLPGAKLSNSAFKPSFIRIFSRTSGLSIVFDIPPADNASYMLERDPSNQDPAIIYVKPYSSTNPSLVIIQLGLDHIFDGDIVYTTTTTRTTTTTTTKTTTTTTTIATNNDYNWEVIPNPTSDFTYDPVSGNNISNILIKFSIPYNLAKSGQTIIINPDKLIKIFTEEYENIIEVESISGGTVTASPITTTTTVAPSDQYWMELQIDYNPSITYLLDNLQLSIGRGDLLEDLGSIDTEKKVYILLQNNKLISEEDYLLDFGFDYPWDSLYSESIDRITFNISITENDTEPIKYTLDFDYIILQFPSEGLIILDDAGNETYTIGKLQVNKDSKKFELTFERNFAYEHAQSVKRTYYFKGYENGFTIKDVKFNKGTIPNFIFDVHYV